MGDLTEAKSLDIGPTYFFDQMKPKRKKWEKRECEDHFLSLRHTSGANYGKAEDAKLKKEGFNKQLTLLHYNDPKGVEKVSNSPQVSQCFWLELLKRKPKMPMVKEADPEMKKFHYALVDGSSLTYYPSGRLAVCQSYSSLPGGGMYTNIFSDLPNQVILGTFTPFGCGSISFPNSRIISMMFNQDGGMVISKKGNIVREWMWPSKGKLDDPVDVWPFPDVNPISTEARELFKAYKVKCKHLKSTTQDKYVSSSSH